MAQDLKDTKRKHRGIKGVFNVDEYRDVIQAYRKRVDDLKMDFLVCFFFQSLSRCSSHCPAVDPCNG